MKLYRQYKNYTPSAYFFIEGVLTIIVLDLLTIWLLYVIVSCFCIRFLLVLVRTMMVF